MEKRLECQHCSKFLGTIKKGSIRKGNVTFCVECSSQIPDFIAMKEMTTPETANFYDMVKKLSGDMFR